MFFPDLRARRLGLTAAAAVMAVAVAGTAAAQSMVVRSTGPSAADVSSAIEPVAAQAQTLTQTRSSATHSDTSDAIRVRPL